MSLMQKLRANVVEYAKSMPEEGKAEESDFEAWGRGFCSRMVRPPVR
jgi:hypothetical protein